MDFIPHKFTDSNLLISNFIYFFNIETIVLKHLHFIIVKLSVCFYLIHGCLPRLTHSRILYVCFEQSIVQMK